MSQRENESIEIFKENIEAGAADLAHLQTCLLLEVQAGPLRDRLLLTTSRIQGNLQEARAVGEGLMGRLQA